MATDDKAKSRQLLEKGKGAQEVGDTDKLAGAALKGDENDMPNKPGKAKSVGRNEIERSDRDASNFPDKEKKKRLRASPGDSENADKQEVGNETVHKSQKLANEGTAFGKVKAFVKKKAILIGATVGGSLGVGIGATLAKKYKQKRSSGSGKANQVTQKKENQVSD